MYCISINYKKAPAEVRQNYAFSEEEQAALLEALKSEQLIHGGVLVSTCNRSELYVHLASERAQEPVIRRLSEYKSVSPEMTKKYGMFFEDKKAILHLYKVVCGLDSMVLGEDEILHQVKNAYLLADRRKLLDADLNMIFQGAFSCSKQSKTETDIKNTPVSIGTLTANAIEDFVRTHQEPARGEPAVLVIGATGQIGSIVAKDLVAKGIKVIGTTRKRHSSDALFYTDAPNMEWIDFERRYEVLGQVCSVVSATASPHYILLRDEFIATCDSDRDYLLVDLAVPYDIDQLLADEEQISLYDIDYFKELSKQNNALKQDMAEQIQNLVDQGVDDVRKKLAIRGFQKAESDKFQEDWFRKMVAYLRDSLTADELSRVFTKIIENQMDDIPGEELS